VPFSRERRGEGWQVAEGAGSGDMVGVVVGFDDRARAQDARQVRRDATIDEVYLLVRSLAQASAAMPVPPDARQSPTGQETVILNQMANHDAQPVRPATTTAPSHGLNSPGRHGALAK